VLAGARSVLGSQPTALGELLPARGPGARIAIVRHHDVTAEAAGLAARFADLHSRGVAWHEIAVLCRLRAQVADLAAALTTRGVPCVYDLEGVVEPTAPTVAGEPTGVRVLTIHAAKGLEFTHVFLSGANVGVLPLLSRDPDADPGATGRSDPAEERRLLFVAITRARDAVEISYHACPHAYGAFAVPSPLLALLPADLVTRDDGRGAPPPSPAPVAASVGPAEWHVGQRVRHARYGQGTITAVAADTIDCDFGKLGPRAFPRALCPLT
jgi:superfamily I DNA/RNA helicase